MEVSEALLIMFTFFKSANTRKNENRAIKIYCENGEYINCRETYAWSQNL